MWRIQDYRPLHWFRLEITLTIHSSQSETMKCCIDLQLVQSTSPREVKTITVTRFGFSTEPFLKQKTAGAMHRCTLKFSVTNWQFTTERSGRTGGGLQWARCGSRHTLILCQKLFIPMHILFVRPLAKRKARICKPRLEVHKHAAWLMCCQAQRTYIQS